MFKQTLKAFHSDGYFRKICSTLRAQVHRFLVLSIYIPAFTCGTRCSPHRLNDVKKEEITNKLFMKTADIQFIHYGGNW